jgi:hypothetical protein
MAGLAWHPVIGVVVVLLIMVFRRWRHLLVFMLGLFFLEIAGGSFYYHLSRRRPYGVPIIGSWGGYSAPSLVVTVQTFFLMGLVYSLAVPGRPRSYAKGRCRGGGCPVLPVQAVPGRRSPGRRAVRRRPRGGYTGHGVPVLHPERGVQHCLPPRPDRARRRDRPARRGDPAGGVRADRWYKLWRTILYGALEDERPFYSVRQLTQYENHGLRLLREAGIPPRRRTESWRSRRSAGTSSSPSCSSAQSRSAPRTSMTTSSTRAAAYQEAVGCRRRAPGHQAGNLMVRDGSCC